MIKGLGLDLADVKRIGRAYERFGRRFLERCFTPEEAAVCLSRSDVAGALAMRFAAKEAFSKAAGLGMRGLAWREIEVIHDERGKPDLRLHGRALARMAELDATISHISLTDDGGVAAAVVVLEGI